MVWFPEGIMGRDYGFVVNPHLFSQDQEVLALQTSPAPHSMSAL